MKPAELLKALESVANNAKADTVIFELAGKNFSRELVSRQPSISTCKVFPRDVFDLMKWIRDNGLPID